jgi:hypothetical protein
MRRLRHRRCAALADHRRADRQLADHRDPSGRGEVPGRPAIFDLLVTLAVVLAYASVGALLVSRRPRNLVGWLLTASGCASG